MANELPSLLSQYAEFSSHSSMSANKLLGMCADFGVAGAASRTLEQMGFGWDRLGYQSA